MIPPETLLLLLLAIATISPWLSKQNISVTHSSHSLLPPPFNMIWYTERERKKDTKTFSCILLFSSFVIWLHLLNIFTGKCKQNVNGWLWVNLVIKVTAQGKRLCHCFLITSQPSKWFPWKVHHLNIISIEQSISM